MHMAFYRTLIAIILSALGAPAFADAFNTIDPQQAYALTRQGAPMFDVRELHEYREAHAPGALLLPLAQLKNRVHEFRAFENKPIVIICRSGTRSAAAAAMLAELGFKSVHNVQGGMIAWEKAGLPVERR